MKQYVLMSNEELGELEHFGVRGMKWGVRKSPVTRGIKRAVGRNAVTRGVKRAVGWGPIKAAGRRVASSKSVKKWYGAQKRAAKKVGRLEKEAYKAHGKNLKKNWKNPKKALKNAYNIEKKAYKKQWNAMTKTQKAALTTAVTMSAAVLGYNSGMKVADIARTGIGLYRNRRNPRLTTHVSRIYDQNGNVWR